MIFLSKQECFLTESTLFYTYELSKIRLNNLDISHVVEIISIFSALLRKPINLFSSMNLNI